MPITNIVAYFHWGNRLLGNMADQFRGGVTIEKRENLGQIPKGGGGVKKNRRKFPISIWEFEKPRGERGLNFSKMSEFQLFDSVVCNFTFIRNV